MSISSGAGSVAGRSDARGYPYGASKAALNLAFRALAKELKSDRIAVIALSPEWVRTDRGGLQAQIEIEDSVGPIEETIHRLTLANTDTFVDRFGQTGAYQW